MVKNLPFLSISKNIAIVNYIISKACCILSHDFYISFKKMVVNHNIIPKIICNFL